MLREMLPWLGLTAIALLFVEAKVDRNWSALRKLVFRVSVGALFFVLLGIYWLMTGESPVETAYRRVLCPFVHSARCTGETERQSSSSGQAEDREAKRLPAAPAQAPPLNEARLPPAASPAPSSAPAFRASLRDDFEQGPYNVRDNPELCRRYRGYADKYLAVCVDGNAAAEAVFAAHVLKQLYEYCTRIYATSPQDTNRISAEEFRLRNANARERGAQIRKLSTSPANATRVLQAIKLAATEGTWSNDIRFAIVDSIKTLYAAGCPFGRVAANAYVPPPKIR